MLTIGCHLSSSAGFLAMGKEAVKINANTFQFFTRNPRGGTAKPLDLKDVADFQKYRKENLKLKLKERLQKKLNQWLFPKQKMPQHRNRQQKKPKQDDG